MSDKFIIDPIHAAVQQGGFSPEKGGNLRDHDGCYPNEAAIASTTHYDGDYGSDRPTPEQIGKKQGFKVAPADRDPKPTPRPEVTKMGMLKAVLGMGDRPTKGVSK